jgi:hypothetical protein
MNIITVDLKSETRYKEIKAISLKDSLKTKADQLLECVRIKNNYIMCIYREKFVNNDYSLVILDPQYNLKYEEIIHKHIYAGSNVGLLFGKLIGLNDENVIFCFNTERNKIKCELIKISDDASRATITSSYNINNSVIPNINSELILNNSSVILGFKEYNTNSSIVMVNITIKSIEIFNFNVDVLRLYEFKFLEENNGKIIILMDYISLEGGPIGIHDSNYSDCRDIVQKIYNGKTTKINIGNYTNPILNTKENWGKIIFSFDDETLNSLVDEKGIEIKSGKIYSKNNIYFKLNSDNYKYMENHSVYSVMFFSDIDEKKSQRCYLNLSFYSCPSKCELCSDKSECYDRYWNAIKEEEEQQPKSSANYAAYIIITIIVVVIIILLALLLFRTRRKKNFEYISSENLIKEQSPIVNEYDSSPLQNQNINNNNKLQNQKEVPLDTITQKDTPDIMSSSDQYNENSAAPNPTDYTPS